MSHLSNVQLQYELPSTIRSIRDGWQTTFQSAAVVSGLLVGVAAQLYSFFKDKDNYTGNFALTRNAVVGLCYCALFLNIGAAIGGFIIIDGLGEMHYHAASAANQLHSQGGMPGSTMELVVRYDGGSYWRWLVYHWLFSFGAGILSLILLLIVFICSQENAGVIAVSIGLGLFTLVPVGFVFFNNRPPKRYAQLPHAPSPSVVSRPPLQHASQSPRDYMMSGTPVDKNELAVITGGQAIDGFSATRNP